MRAFPPPTVPQQLASSSRRRSCRAPGAGPAATATMRSRAAPASANVERGPAGGSCVAAEVPRHGTLDFAGGPPEVPGTARARGPARGPWHRPCPRSLAPPWHRRGTDDYCNPASGYGVRNKLGATCDNGDECTTDNQCAKAAAALVRRRVARPDPPGPARARTGAMGSARLISPAVVGIGAPALPYAAARPSSSRHVPPSHRASRHAGPGPPVKLPSCATSNARPSWRATRTRNSRSACGPMGVCPRSHRETVSAVVPNASASSTPDKPSMALRKRTPRPSSRPG